MFVRRLSPTYLIKLIIITHWSSFFFIFFEASFGGSIPVAVDCPHDNIVYTMCATQLSQLDFRPETNKITKKRFKMAGQLIGVAIDVTNSSKMIIKNGSINMSNNRGWKKMRTNASKEWMRIVDGRELDARSTCGDNEAWMEYFFSFLSRACKQNWGYWREMSVLG